MAAEPVRLKVGEEYELTLQGLGSVGYRWDFVVEEGSEVVRVTESGTGSSHVEADTTPRSSSADLLFFVHGLAPGRARVHFMLQRPWMIGKAPPAQERILEITIV